MNRRSGLLILALATVLFILNACGSDSATESASETPESLSPETTAGEVATSEVESTDAPHPATGFADEVLPILENVCTQCHSPGGPGSTHWELQTAGDAVKHCQAFDGDSILL